MKGKRNITLLLWLLISVAAMAQDGMTVLSGIVRDRETGAVLRQANVSVPEQNVSTVTNDDGRFTLKTTVRPGRIQVSHIGYRSRYVAVTSDNARELVVRMAPSAVMLSEIIVAPDDPVEIMNQAINRIPENYGKESRLMQTFYRETVQKRNKFIYIAEAVADLLKTGYHRSRRQDRVAITKGRRLLSPRQSDTLAVKIQGGPVLALDMDFVKNTDFLFNTEELQHYGFRMAEPEKIDDRLQCVVEMFPKMAAPYALYHGRFYIDYESYTFTRAEFSLDMGDREKATKALLVKKPVGLKFKPRELTCVINFRQDGAYSRINYVRTDMRFNCDWKRRLFSTSYKVVTEMVVTDVFPQLHDIKGSESFSGRDAFFDRVEFFADPDFWKDYNIIEPTESLEHAIGKLRKLGGS